MLSIERIKSTVAGRDLPWLDSPALQRVESSIMLLMEFLNVGNLDFVARSLLMIPCIDPLGISCKSYLINKPNTKHQLSLDTNHNHSAFLAG